MFIGLISFSVILLAWRSVCASLRCGNRCFRNGQRKAIIRTHLLSETSSDYFGLVPVVGLEPTRCCHQRILSPHRLPFRHTGVRIAFILYYAAFVKSSVFCPQNAKKTISGLFSARRRAGLCRRGALPVSAAQRDSRRGLPVSAVQRDSRRALPVSAVQRDSRRGLPVPAAQRDSRRGLPVPAAQRDSRRGLPQQASHC